MALPIFLNITYIEALGKVKIHLHRRNLPIAPYAVLDFDINFRSIKNPFAGIDLEVQRFIVQGIFQSLGGVFPALFRADIFIRPGAQIDFVFEEPERLQNINDQFENLGDFLFNLGRTAKQVRVILREPAHAEQAV